MPHKRQQIREAVAALLSGKTRAVDRVFTSRDVQDVPWKRLELPAIAVTTPDETSEDASVDLDEDRELRRAMKLKVTVGESITERILDALDDLALEVETALRDHTLGGVATHAVLTATTTGPAEAQGRPFGAAELTYDVEYFTQ